MAEASGATSDAVRTGQALWIEMRTPDGPAWQGLAKSITVPGAKGSMGVMPRHAPLMSSLDVGLTKVRAQDGSESRWITGSGFVEVFQNKVLLLVDFADASGDIDKVRAEKAKERAQARLRSVGEETDRARAEAALNRALMRLQYSQPKI
jgi:F-type H+-transporting ATPase subunit epsilon